MKKEIISVCPICSADLMISKLHCKRCGVEISGDFVLPTINKLSKEQLAFVIMFLKNQGNIKAVEKEMNVSYQTVKKILNEVLATLGFDVNEDALSGQRQEILDRLSRREISFEEANELLKKLK